MLWLRLSQLCFILFWIATLVYACLPVNVPNAGLTIGGSTYICLILSRFNWTEPVNGVSTTGKYVQFPSKATADQLSQITIKNSWNSWDYNVDPAMQSLDIPYSVGEGLAISVASMGVLSFQKIYRYHDGKLGRTFPMMMAVIFVEKGVVTRIDWDDNCIWCARDTERCRSNTLSFEGELLSGGENCAVVDRSLECVKNPSIQIANTTTAFCQLSVYFVWTGTDSRGTYFTSVAERFSRFSHYQLSDFAEKQQEIFVNVNSTV